MSLLQWLNSTEAGFVFYFPLGLLLCLAIVSTYIAARKKWYFLLILPTLCIALSVTLFNFVFSEYQKATKAHFDAITLISKKIFKREPESSRILLYRNAFDIGIFYFQVDFSSAMEARLGKGKEWLECEHVAAGSECREYDFQHSNPSDGETPCSIDPEKAFAASHTRIGFTEEQYEKNEYSDAFIVRNPEKTAYCFYWNK
ncbi:hypothetical protein GCM10008959_13600 [Deinococcus seoulensis]|uniref:Uncharacterized protein n=2 Tax=Deinococcus TaxID=1298 RepID=A0ABQ2RQT9_9DEIO|nr:MULTISPECIES: hypothetical protein [Deinococcus]GGR53286.1 hypothetical protein GCM10008959_13600 [Deinococcus seoulensis]GGS31117.1 hypothetical protein GCM10008961_23660 [Deinococcus knuensis]